jgi:uncharacterized protein
LDKTKRLDISLLNDYYGLLLTEYQSRLVAMYYDDDLSLAEIALENDTSRQAVRDVLVRAEAKLRSFEEKLGLIEKIKVIKKELKKIMVAEDTEIKIELQSLIDKVDEL